MTSILRDNSLVRRGIAGAVAAVVIIPLWGVFDFIIDPHNFKIFLILRIIFVFIMLIGLGIFVKNGAHARHYRKLSLLTYISLIITIIPMVIMTTEKYSYYIGFSTVFFSVSIMMIWPLRYFLIPMLGSGLVLIIAERPTIADLRTAVTGIFLMLNISSLTTLGSWLTYRSFLENEAILKQLESLSNKLKRI